MTAQALRQESIEQSKIEAIVDEWLADIQRRVEEIAARVEKLKRQTTTSHE